MRHCGRLAAALAAVIVCSGPWSEASAAQAPVPAPVPKDFTVIGKTTRVDVDGEVVTFNETLFDGVRGKRVGRARYRCRFSRRSSSCSSARFSFDDGKILARGRIGEAKVRVPGENKASTLPIVDGTGAYKDVTGKLIFNGITRRLTQERFNFDG